ncbi:FMN reductase [Nocardia sp. NPDC049220]|uniref:FMN reductase n=1 Tax=Nocardia sp. NPDC049220 TaxID=3155273 RepID=UPI0033F4FC6A
MTRVAVVSAGLSEPSSTRLLADRLAAAADRALSSHGRDVTFDVIEMRSHAHDLTNSLLTGFAAGGLRETINGVATADGLIAVTPIFNASFSGLFKLFFDVLETDSLAGMPVLIGATGGSARHSLALEHAVRPMFSYLRAMVVPTSVYAAAEDWASSEADGLNVRIDRAAAEFAATVTTTQPRRGIDPYDDPVPFAQLLA